MGYHSATKKRVRSAPRSLGSRLGRLAVYHGYSVQTISEITGASRPAVYSWIAGGSVARAYRAAVTKLIEKLEAL